MSLFLAALLALPVACAAPGTWSWQPSRTVTPSAQLREDDLACRRASLLREPGQNLSMDWSAHRACMADRGWVPARVARKRQAPAPVETATEPAVVSQAP